MECTGGRNQCSLFGLIAYFLCWFGLIFRFEHSNSVPSFFSEPALDISSADCNQGGKTLFDITHMETVLLLGSLSGGTVWDFAVMVVVGVIRKGEVNLGCETGGEERTKQEGTGLLTGLCAHLGCLVSVDRMKAWTGCKMAQLWECKPQFGNHYFM